MSAPIDTSKMSEGKRAALELTEAARDDKQQYRSFGSGLFMGHFDWSVLYPYPVQSDADRAAGEPFLGQLRDLLRTVDADEIDKTGEIPQPIIDALAKMGAFGIKIPKEYGGLGLSQTNYCRAAVQLGSLCGNLTALISAHQSIGVPQPLLLFGTEEQKKKYLTRVAAGEISAFALTEKAVGSDPARMETRADPSPDGSHFILNGEKLWCTNGTRAGVLVVMAKTPPKVVDGKSRDQVTAFIVETNWPGVKVLHRCRFMGLHALYNAVVEFKNVKVPRENIILAEGKGLKVALSTLNTGRLTLPAACIGLVKRCLEVSTKWCKDRVQWGAPIGHHSAIADKIARMAGDLFAMESMTFLTAAMVDRHDTDIRLEAAMCKMWGTEATWRIVDDTMELRGGRGYETAESLRNRGEEGVAVERWMRDCRINIIFEGSSEIMRLFIAREALDTHLRTGAAVINSKLPMSQRMSAAGKATAFYARWYPKQWLPFGGNGYHGMDPSLVRHAEYASATSKRLARSLFHAMAKHGPKLEREQLLLSRFVDIGTELFAIAASCSRAQALLKAGTPRDQLMPVVDFFCREARRRIEQRFEGTCHNNDRASYKLARQMLDSSSWLREGVI
jgi:alkylation response protein AidB-like acyl-CoA dehydrogenase